MEYRNFKTPLIYTANVLKERQRTPKEAWFGEIVEVPIAITDENEAPIAARWVEIESSKEMLIKEIRFFNGKLYLPYTIGNTKEVAKTNTLDGEIIFSDDFNPLAGVFKSHQHAAVRTAYSLFESGSLQDSVEEYRTVSSCNKEENLKKLNEWADSLILINDELWYEENEPLLVLTINSSGWRQTAKTSISSNADGLQPYQAAFSFTEYDDIQFYINSFFTDDLEEVFVYSDVKDIEIYIPEAFAFDTLSRMVDRFSHEVRSAFKSRVIEHGREITNAWFDIEDIANLPGVEADKIIETLGKFLRLIENEGGHHFQKLHAIEQYMTTRSINLLSHYAYK